MGKKSFLKSIRKYFGGEAETVLPTPSQRLRLSGRSIRIPIQNHPFAVELGRQRLHIYPDIPLDASARQAPYDFILFDPDRFASKISYPLRLAPHDTLTISHHFEDQKYVFSAPREAFRRHFQIEHEGDALIFKDTISELGSYVTLIDEPSDASWIIERRRRALQHLVDIFGGPLEPLPPAKALEVIRQVNQALKKDFYRKQDCYGNAGGIVELPAHLTPIILGDLHGQIDNLLKILSENAFMDSLRKGEAALIILGDAVHPEEPKQLEQMDSSVLLMDLILKLKLRFPRQVFLCLGNHDGFGTDIMKGGVAQGLLWGKRLTELRGEAYKEQMALFYQQSPLAIFSENFLACHAGPPRSKVSVATLVDIRQFPELVHELTWNRPQKPGHPSGYSARDVRRFRKSLGLDKQLSVIVAHTPQSQKDTLWMNVQHIDDHHIVYSARTNQIGVFTRIGDQMLPQIYPTETLLGWINGQLASGEMVVTDRVPEAVAL